MDSNVEKALKAASRFFRSFRPVVSVDPTTGSQSYSFTLDPQNVDRLFGIWLARQSH